MTGAETRAPLLLIGLIAPHSATAASCGLGHGGISPASAVPRAALSEYAISRRFRRGLGRAVAVPTHVMCSVRLADGETPLHIEPGEQWMGGSRTASP